MRQKEISVPLNGAVQGWQSSQGGGAERQNRVACGFAAEDAIEVKASAGSSRTPTINIHRVYLTLAKLFRPRRDRWVQQEFHSCKSVIDVGGSPLTWERLTFPDRITILNWEERPRDAALNSKSHYVRANALVTPFRDQTFDLAFANSVIEHVGDTKQQKEFAAEMLRVGRRVYCQTPNRWFPVEPHYLTLLVHLLPRACFTYFVHRYMTVHGLITKPSREKHERIKAGIRLLNRRELQRLFPGCKIKTERFLGIPKSYAAYR